MKINNIFTLIEEYRNGRDIWTRNHVELAVREIRRLDKENLKLWLRLAASKNDILLREVNEMLKTTQSRVQELEDEQMWIPVSEKPEHSDRYLVRRYADVNGIRGLYISILPYNDLGGWTDSSITHWRPLPQPPKDGES